ncbi:Na/Pi cotransporter family protein [Desulfuromonas sp. KJ2020]|uniref:Na/Pi cotransporter family protein n=1 Tax=Desulfuromonas sp. KJ2020 TaxID=2919173 RepID=UPI0020A83695|nr:Na/Pi cotransporter family protein [Desulfuromonas sp. KJ2020]MCP3177881.1 Na/Pi cotransporter family protein [Desulfuromonas sp. KJ2020]
MLDILLNQTLIFGLFGGLGLFLFGMKIMSEGLQKVAGDKMRKILSALTANRFISTLVGLSVTAIIQSSSATTVMVVGFVNAGLMSLYQAIGVVLGANIGTTITAQLIAFKITAYALPAIGAGTALKLFSRNRKWVYAGEILLGFGILFFGLATMKEAFEPVKTSVEFRDMFLLVGDHYLLGVFIGAVLTIIVQSSTATLGITLALATSGIISFEASVVLILGENIGTTITANLAAIGTNLAARRTALAHFLFNLIGVAYMVAFLPIFMNLVDMITPGAADFVIETQNQAASFGGSVGDKPFIARHIANTHTLFNIINTLIFLPMIGILAKLSTLLIRGKDVEMEYHLKYIDSRVLNTPPIALGQARAETRRMAQMTLEMLEGTIEFLADNNDKSIPALEKKEEAVDLLQREITDFLVALSQQSISQDSSKDIASLMHMVNDLERVGDHCENLWRLGLRRKGEKVTFSEIANAEIQEIGEKSKDFLSFTVQALERQDKTIQEKASFMEEEIDQLEETFRNNHIARLNTSECAVDPGLIFVDMLHNFEKIGDHTFNVTRAIIGQK